MKTRFLILVIVVTVIAISGFFVYATIRVIPNIQHHDEVNPPRPDDRFRTEGMKWEWHNYVYDINEEINFTVSRHADSCGDVFSAHIMNPDWSKTFWQESVKSRCDVEADYDELINNGDFSVLVTADFPSEKPIKLTEEGLYVLRIESQDRGYGALEGQFIVKNKTNVLPIEPTLSESQFEIIKKNIEQLGYDICDIRLGENKMIIDLNQIFEGTKQEKQIISQIPSETNYEIIYHDGYTDYFISKITTHSCGSLESQKNNPEKSTQEHYEIEIIGLKDKYSINEPYSFYFIISGFGYACASYEISYPDENGNIMKTSVHVLCAAEQTPMQYFEINYLEQKGTLGNVGIKNSGQYTVTVTFEKPNQFFPTTASKKFHVVGD